MITPNEALGQLLPSYQRYYDVSHEQHGSFAATARFYSRGEGYLLVRAAKMWEMESNEFVYFLTADTLSDEQLNACVEEAWDDAMPQVQPMIPLPHPSSYLSAPILSSSLTMISRSTTLLTPRK